MSKRMWCVLGLVAILANLGMVLYAKEPQAQQPGMPAGFSGKFVFVHAGEASATLEEPRLRTLGNRSFIVGKSANDSVLTRPRFPGATLWIPLDQVHEIMEFADLEQLKKLGGQ